MYPCLPCAASHDRQPALRHPLPHCTRGELDVQWHTVRSLVSSAKPTFTDPFPFSSYILGCWYAPSELGKRSAIFAASAQMGSLFSGLMQGAIHSNMDGAKGLAGWRWLFIIDGILAVAIAGYGFVCFPGVPGKVGGECLVLDSGGEATADAFSQCGISPKPSASSPSRACHHDRRRGWAGI